MVTVTNQNGTFLVGRCGGEEYEFPPGQTVSVSDAVANYLFHFGKPTCRFHITQVFKISEKEAAKIRFNEAPKGKSDDRPSRLPDSNSAASA